MSHRNNSLPWPPQPPDLTKEAFGNILGHGLQGHSKISFVKDNLTEIYKGLLSANEYRNHMAAGSCAVAITRKVLALEGVHGSASEPDYPRVYVWGFMMSREEVLDYRVKLAPELRRSICRELSHLVHTLHSKFRIIHGDIKTSNILRCRDGKLRFCDLADARMLDDDDWDGEITAEISSPRRNRNPCSPPIVQDDLYSLGVTLWMLYSHRIPEIPIEWLHSGGTRIVKPIDIELITDEDIKEQVRGYLASSEVIV